MRSLPQNWDGWGTASISRSAHRVGRQIVEAVPDDAAWVKVFVGVAAAGSLFVEISQGPRVFEMTVDSGGTVSWDEVIVGTVCGSGRFPFSKDKLMEVLSL